MRIKRGTLHIAIGLLLIAAAVVWACVNMRIDRRGGENADRILSELRASVPTQSVSIEAAEPTPMDVLGRSEVGAETEIPDYVLNPEMDMPVQEVAGTDYLGYLSIPALGLDLPVASEWSYALLRSTPCRYTGSIYTRDIIIAGHNYSHHFGDLHELCAGDELYLTDVDGNQFAYTVEFIETLEGNAVEEMLGGGFDLTLFTCTVGGSHRVCVRCSLEEERPFLISEN